MESFRTYLQQEFLRRTAKNKSYSLRAFAKTLGTNHATLSSILAGKRKITAATLTKFADVLGLGPNQTQEFTSTNPSATVKPYYLIQQDVFNSISDWYFDAILQLSLIPKIKLEPAIISTVLGITKLEAKMALETLERLDLFKKDSKGFYKKTHKNSTNILDPDFTNAAMKKYQKQILEKSLEALENIPRTKRDHTSTTIAIQKEDLPNIKKLIQKFRHELDHYLQRNVGKINEVYQLQISFFPLTNLNLKSKKQE
jgi:uncharacterized protein (TIGR02147 family)